MCDTTEYNGTCADDCKGVVLETAGKGDVTSSLGTMFSVFSSCHIVVKSLHIYSNFKGIDWVEVYTKKGLIVGYESDRKAWKQI
jgi:hypothetical protein